MKAFSYERKTFAILEDGTDVGLHIISDGTIKATMTDYGASWVSAIVPSARAGNGDVLLGFSNLQGYMSTWGAFGAVMGRYANRIRGAKFSIDGVEHRLDANFGPHILHGGRTAWSKRLWTAEGGADDGKASVTFSLRSADGESGFPGNVDARVTYSLKGGNSLEIEYSARTDAPTHINMSNHAYFNLKGRGDILSHELLIGASSFLHTDRENVPSGKLKAVKGSALDFSSAKAIGRDLRKGKGYDSCFALDRKEGELFLVAEAYEPETGRRMRVLGSQPGVQLYTSCFGHPLAGKRSSWYRGAVGFCLETQHFPDSPNRPSFPSTLLRPGEDYLQKTIYEFGC